MGKLMAGMGLVMLLGMSSCARPPLPVEGPELATSQFVVAKGGKLQDGRLVETSGLAASRRNSELLWAVNDSGNKPTLYALNADGRKLGQVALAGVENVDWEDLAAFSWQGKSWLLVADVGDNRAQRLQVVLHVFTEPRADGEGYFSGAVYPAWSLVFSYPDGPRDCEAVAVDGAAGRILLLSKRSEPPMLYSLPLAPPADDRPLVATPLGPLATIPPPTPADLLLPYGRYRSQPTAMDLSADGRELLVLTYRHAYLLRRNSGQDWDAVLADPLQPVELPDLFTLAQREAACFSADGQSLFVTGEGAGAVLLRLQRK